jgi:hypothetical protein
MHCTPLGNYAVCSDNCLPMFPFIPTFEGQESKKEYHNKDVVGISKILLYASFSGLISN